MEEKKIDYVIPFVNMNDEIWQAEREKYSTDDVAIKEDFKDAKALLVDKLQQFLPDKRQFEKKK